MFAEWCRAQITEYQIPLLTSLKPRGVPSYLWLSLPSVVGGVVCDSSCCSFSDQWASVGFTFHLCCVASPSGQQARRLAQSAAVASAVSTLFWVCLEYWNQVCSSWNYNSLLLAKGIVVEWYLKWGWLGFVSCGGQNEELGAVQMGDKNCLEKNFFQYAGSEQRTASTFTLSRGWFAFPWQKASPGVTSLRQRSLHRWGWCNWILSQGFKGFLL